MAREQVYYFECGSCGGTVEWTVDRKLHPGAATSGAVGGAAVGSLIPVVGTIFGAIVGAGMATAGARMRKHAQCTDCGVVYDAYNVRLLREKAVPTGGLRARTSTSSEPGSSDAFGSALRSGSVDRAGSMLRPTASREPIKLGGQDYLGTILWVLTVLTAWWIGIMLKHPWVGIASGLILGFNVYAAAHKNWTKGLIIFVSCWAVGVAIGHAWVGAGVGAVVELLVEDRRSRSRTVKARWNN